MPIESIPLKSRTTPRTLRPPNNNERLHHQDHDDSSSARFSSPVIISQASSRQLSPIASPLAELQNLDEELKARKPVKSRLHEDRTGSDLESETDLTFEDWDDHAIDMPSDLRSESRHAGAPLLAHKPDVEDYGAPRAPLSRRSTFHERDPETQAKLETRKRYTYAAIFLALSLVSFTVQTETAVYIQHELKWEKPYCMLYMTHGSWVLLWPTLFVILRLQNWSTPWPAFWRRHVQMLRQTALMVQHQTLHPSVRLSHESPVNYILKITAIVTCSLTVAGGSWYIAVNMTTASDLTAIYNCSAFFAYAFSIPLLHEKVCISKVIAVAIAIAGVFVVAYGDRATAKGGDKGPPSNEASSRTLGNIIIGIGSVLYGFYEVLYKRLACPPDQCSPTRGMIFAMTFGSLIGAFTLCFLWIPLPLLHYMGWEEFALPKGPQAWMMAISVLSNATFSGSFLILISLTSPVLSSVAALLTIFIVAIVDQLLPPPLNSPLTPAAIVGGILIIGAFGLLSWATYKEMDEERKKKLEVDESDLDD